MSTSTCETQRYKGIHESKRKYTKVHDLKQKITKTHKVKKKWNSNKINEIHYGKEFYATELQIFIVNLIYGDFLIKMTS